MLTRVLDIKVKAPFPAGMLSNFAPHSFVVDGVECACMEAFLQSLKVEDPDRQASVCGLPGSEAQKAGRGRDWQFAGTLWWRGTAIDRLSEDYQKLLDHAYESLFAQCRRFRAALLATEDVVLTHRIGKAEPWETVLTSAEFCDRLERLRRRLPTNAPSMGR